MSLSKLSLLDNVITGRCRRSRGIVITASLSKNIVMVGYSESMGVIIAEHHDLILQLSAKETHVCDSCAYVLSIIYSALKF